MNYNICLIFFLSLFLFNCETSNYQSSKKINLEIKERYKNSGFALVYNSSQKDIKEIDPYSLGIYHKFLKRKSVVKITNPNNGNSLIAEVISNRVKFSSFYNSVLSPKIVDILDLDIEEPYVEIILVSKKSTYVAKKTKTFDEEKKVAQTAPIDGIQIKDLNEKKITKLKKKKKAFSYSIKVADFYYEDTAKMMSKRINDQTTVKKLNIIKISPTKFRVLIGPFNDINSLKDSFEKMNSLNFENLEILKNV